jgi:hypothetical protein
LKALESTDTHTVVFETYVVNGVKHVEARSQTTFENTSLEPLIMYIVADGTREELGTISKRVVSFVT